MDKKMTCIFLFMIIVCVLTKDEEYQDKNLESSQQTFIHNLSFNVSTRGYLRSNVSNVSNVSINSNILTKTNIDFHSYENSSSKNSDTGLRGYEVIFGILVFYFMYRMSNQ
jgi:hypothetical protein